jgi:ankyrin repeat protein
MRQGGCTPLHDAATRQDIASALALLEGGADINAQNTVSAMAHRRHVYCIERVV